MRSNRVATTTNEMLASLALARSEAIRSSREQPALRQRRTATSCATGLERWAGSSPRTTMATARFEQIVRYVQAHPRVVFAGTAPQRRSFSIIAAVRRPGDSAGTITLQPDQCPSRSAFGATLTLNSVGQVTTKQGVRAHDPRPFAEVSAPIGSTCKQRGFSMIEVLIALVVLAVGLLGLALLQTTNLRFTKSANQRTQAVNLATEMLDMIRANHSEAAAYAAIDPASFAGVSATARRCPADAGLTSSREHHALEVRGGRGARGRCVRRRSSSHAPANADGDRRPGKTNIGSPRPREWPAPAASCWSTQL